MITDTFNCPECSSPLAVLRRDKIITCDQCLSKLLKTDNRLVPYIDAEKTPLRTKAPRINTSELLKVDCQVDPFHVPDKSLIHCVGCERQTDKINSHYVNICKRFGEKRVTTEDTYQGQVIERIVRYPMFSPGYLCSDCFGKLELRTDKQSHKRWYLGYFQVVIRWENTPNETRIPTKERYIPPVLTEPLRTIKEVSVPDTDIVLTVTDQPQFIPIAGDNDSPPAIHEESFKKFGFSRGSRDYRKYLR